MECYSDKEIDRIKETKGKVDFTDEEMSDLLKIAEQFDIERTDGTIETMKKVISHDHFNRLVKIYGKIYHWDTLFGCHPSLSNYFYVLSGKNDGYTTSRVLFYKNTVKQALLILEKARLRV